MQIVSLWFLFSFNKFHQALFLQSANEITGGINKEYKKLENFFLQGEENRRLHLMNDSLLNLLSHQITLPDTTRQLVTDTLVIDSSRQYRRYYFRPASVVYNSTNSEKNYIQLDRGSIHGIAENMAVLNADGSAVGIVVQVSPRFSQVMSLLHVRQKINVALQLTGDFGTLEWDGKDPGLLLLKGLPKSVLVKLGDPVVVSRYSFNFPPDYPVGTVAEIINDKGTNFYLLKVKPAARFNRLQHVSVVENLQYAEQATLDREARKKIDDTKRSGQ
ncbi:MAG: rod shape-determining protein MreC [Bacteroidetes bacterium]|nr:rod shape-determining protein MreC [Bacteroidota bacterium]